MKSPGFLQSYGLVCQIKSWIEFFFQNIRGNAAVETCVLTGSAVKSDAVLISMCTAIHMDVLSRSLFIELE